MNVGPRPQFFSQVLVEASYQQLTYNKIVTLNKMWHKNK